jgi:hypothetical protein
MQAEAAVQVLDPQWPQVPQAGRGGAGGAGGGRAGRGGAGRGGAGRGGAGRGGAQALPRCPAPEGRPLVKLPLELGLVALKPVAKRSPAP